MIFDRFEIGALPYIHDASCECGARMEQVTNGMLSKAMFCPKCENVYVLKLVKLPKKKVTQEFLEQSRKAIKNRQ